MNNDGNGLTPELPLLYLVVPCYNEDAVLQDSAVKLKAKLADLWQKKLVSPRSKIAFVNDGSRDKTWELIENLSRAEGEPFVGINLSHNEGHQNALLAGLMTVRDWADITVSLDADLQDDVNAIDEMIVHYLEGANIVYGVRRNRDKDTLFKRYTAEGFYKFMQYMGAEIVFNHADFRLMDKRALAALADYSEVNLFLRGIVPMIGLKTACVYYDRLERVAGNSKYPLRRMISFAWQGVTSLSTRPIQIIAEAGMIISSISGIIFLYSLVEYFLGKTVIGWTSLIVSLWFLGGMILLAIGIIGQYVAKIYLEVKRRPRYLVADIVGERK